jgi:hypothetical protein
MPDIKLVDIAAELRHETHPESSSKGAYLIWDGANQVWLAKSMTEMHKEGRTTIFTIPEWLATEKGLI